MPVPAVLHRDSRYLYREGAAGAGLCTRPRLRRSRDALQKEPWREAAGGSKRLSRQTTNTTDETAGQSTAPTGSGLTDGCHCKRLRCRSVYQHGNLETISSPSGPETIHRATIQPTACSFVGLPCTVFMAKATTASFMCPSPPSPPLCLSSPDEPTPAPVRLPLPLWPTTALVESDLGPAAHRPARSSHRASPERAAEVPVVARRTAAPPPRPSRALACAAAVASQCPRARRHRRSQRSPLGRSKAPCQWVVSSHPRRLGRSVLPLSALHAAAAIAPRRRLVARAKARNQVAKNKLDVKLLLPFVLGEDGRFSPFWRPHHLSRLLDSMSAANRPWMWMLLLRRQ